VTVEALNSSLLDLFTLSHKQIKTYCIIWKSLDKPLLRLVSTIYLTYIVLISFLPD
jgi:hypothetical protein